MRARKRSSERMAMAFIRRTETLRVGGVSLLLLLEGIGSRGKVSRGSGRASSQTRGNVLWKRPPRPKVGIRPIVWER